MKLTILGQVPSLKNLGKIAKNGHYYTDARVKKYFADAKLQLKSQWKNPPCKEVEQLTFIFYYDSNRIRDLSNSLDTAMDALKGVVISDDNFKVVPRMQIEFGGVSKNPRTEIWVDFETDSA